MLSYRGGDLYTRMVRAEYKQQHRTYANRWHGVQLRLAVNKRVDVTRMPQHFTQLITSDHGAKQITLTRWGNLTRLTSGWVNETESCG